MEIQEIEKQKMDSLRALSETNMEVSKIKATLETLKREESAYIKEREEKVLAQIREMLDESKAITKETLENYATVTDLSNNAKVLAGFVVEAHKELTKLIEVFEETTQNWENEVAGMHKEIAEARKEMKVEAQLLKNEQLSIEKRKIEVANQERKVKDQRETLERAFKRLKK